MKLRMIPLVAVLILVGTGCGPEVDTSKVQAPVLDKTNTAPLDLPYVSKPADQIEPVKEPAKDPIKVEPVKEPVKAPVKVKPAAPETPVVTETPVVQDNPEVNATSSSMPSNPSEGDKYTVGGDTYYYVDGQWTPEDYVHPYGK